MSLPVVKAVLDHSTAKGNARLVLLVMANYANDAGRCWPSVKSIAERCNCPERSVHRSLAILVAAGELVKIGTRYGKVVEYQLSAVVAGGPCQGVTPDEASPDEASPNPDEASPLKAPISPEPCQGVTPTLTRRHPHPDEASPNPSLEPSFNQEKVGAAAAQQAVSVFNSLADELGLVRVQRLTARRRQLLEARLGECGGPQGWAEVLARIRGSPGLRGENNRGWKPDFDWIIDETHFAKLAEGQYDSWGNSIGNGSGRRQSPQEKLVAGFARAAARTSGGQR